LYVFYASITLALGTLSPALPAASVTPGVAIATCFAPEENCNAFAADAVDGAGREILVSAYKPDDRLGDPRSARPRSAARVNVRLIADKTTPCERKAGVDLIVGAGASPMLP
jgi:hypothetical protein